MNAELKAKWIAALRSGEYEQARGSLKLNGGFCCLGVLCDLIGVPFASDESVSVQGWNGEYETLLPITGYHADQLWRRNDGCQGLKEHSFPEIADYIEKNL